MIMTAWGFYRLVGGGASFRLRDLPGCSCATLVPGRQLMTITRKMYLFVAALFVFLVAGMPTKVAAQEGQDGEEGEGNGGLTCGWCYYSIWNDEHWFDNGGDGCGWPNPGDSECSRCGGTSSCHGFGHPDSGGPCHIACGGTTTQQALSDAVSDLRSGLDAMDLVRVAEAITSSRDGVSVEYLPDAGRIDVVLACTPSIPSGTVPVPPEVRPALDRALEGSVTAAAVRNPDAW